MGVGELKTSRIKWFGLIKFLFMVQVIWFILIYVFLANTRKNPENDLRTFPK